VIETIVASISMTVGTRFIKAIAENRDFSGADAGEIATAILQAIVSGQRKTNEDLLRLEKKIDVLTTNPYHAAMASGTRLLEDAAPAHRRPEDRRDMLNQARQAFSEAIGHAHGRALDAARAEVMYGLTGLALGSPEDLLLALDRATSLLQLELITTFQLNAHQQRDAEQRQAATSTRIRSAVLGPTTQLPDSSSTDRFWLAQVEHDAVWNLRLMAEGAPARFPRIVKPHGTSYSNSRPGLPIRFDPGTRQQLLNIFVTLGARTVTLENRGSQLIRFALAPITFAADGVIRPYVSALDGPANTFLSPGTQVQASRLTGPNGVCISLGRNDNEELTVLAHDQLDWSTRAQRDKDSRLGINS
jgi:hypothetical protein